MKNDDVETQDKSINIPWYIYKRILDKTERLEILRLQHDYRIMSEEYRCIRNELNLRIHNCFWCSHEFVDNEKMALLTIKDKGDRVICQNCADSISKAKQNNKEIISD